MAKKFVNLNNVWPIWDKLDELYLRKTDSSVENESMLDLGKIINDIDIDLSNHQPIDITQVVYSDGGTPELDDQGITQYFDIMSFINNFSSRKYIKDDYNIYSIIGEIRNDNSLNEYDGIQIEDQTDKILIMFKDSLYFLWAIHLRTGETEGGSLGTYKIIQDMYMDSITEEFINNLNE